MAQVKRRRKFIDVDMPLIKKETQLYAYDVKELDGRFIKYDLTRTLRGKSVLLSLKVNVEGDKAVARPVEMKVLPYFLRRMVRKGTNYVEDSFSAKCKDAQVRIKPFLVTRKKVSRAVRKALREKAREELINYIKNKNTEILFEEIFRNQLQKSLSLKLKKIYPLSLCEIRVFKVEK
jgi:ribosomal protein S3AE